MCAKQVAKSAPAATPKTKGPRLKTGAPVTGSDFFGRAAEVKNFWKKVESGNNLLLVSPRRVGKTSLMRHVAANPEPRWNPVFVNLEGKKSAASVIVAIVKELEGKAGAGKKIAGLFKKALSSVDELSAFGATVKFNKAAMEHWEHLSAEFETAIGAGASTEERLLLIVDEFPIVIKDLFATEATKREALSLLQLFRKIRTNTDFEDRFRMVVGGSIGLKPILRRNKATADANDLKAFRIGPWTKKTALEFMKNIAETENFPLTPQIQDEILKRTGDQPIPYHLQVMLDGLIELEKDGPDIDVEDVEKVWDDKLGDLDLDHYKERLDSVLEADEVAAANKMLGKIVKDGAQKREALLKLVAKTTVANSALRVLVEDGYCVEAKTSGVIWVRFANPMLEEFWRKHC